MTKCKCDNMKYEYSMRAFVCQDCGRVSRLRSDRTMRELEMYHGDQLFVVSMLKEYKEARDQAQRDMIAWNLDQAKEQNDKNTNDSNDVEETVTDGTGTD